jgi:hypothetical protein
MVHNRLRKGPARKKCDEDGKQLTRHGFGHP